jgi:hypothetical protein
VDAKGAGDKILKLDVRLGRQIQQVALAALYKVIRSLNLPLFLELLKVARVQIGWIVRDRCVACGARGTALLLLILLDQLFSRALCHSAANHEGTKCY